MTLQSTLIFLVTTLGLFNIYSTAKVLSSKDKGSDITLQVGQNYTLFCEGNLPLKWIYPSANKKPLGLVVSRRLTPSVNIHVDNKKKQEMPSYTKISEHNVMLKDKWKFKYTSELIITNITYPFVGYYECMDKNETTNFNKTYLYVNDLHHLSVLNYNEMRLISPWGKIFTLPCRPTSSDVNVTWEKAEKKIELNEPSENIIYRYDPHVGIISNDSNYLSQFNVSCNYQKDNYEYKQKILVKIEDLRPIRLTLSGGGHIISHGVGENLTLTCEVNVVVTELNWITPHQKYREISTTDSEYVSTLIMRNITFEDEGHYACVARDYRGRRSEVGLYHFVYESPHVQLKILENYKMPNEVGIVECIVNSKPEAEIFWRFQPCLDNKCNSEIMNPEYIHFFREGFKLISQFKVTFKKSGKITCSANNSIGYGKDVTEIYVSDIKGGFGIVVLNENVSYDEPDKIRVAEGELLTLSCRVVIGTFHQEIEWSHFSEIIYSNNRYQVEKNSTEFSDRSDLTIHQIVDNDKGLYTCRVYKVSNGMKREELKMGKVELLVSEPMPPKLKKSNMNDTTEINVGEKLELICEFDGLPKPKVTWYKDNEPIISSESRVTIKNIDGYRNASLSFSHITKQDEGTYRCEAVNRLEPQSRETILSFKKQSSSNLYLIIIALLMVVIAIAFIIIYVNNSRKRKLELVLKEAGLAYFETGQIENLNPELGIEDQAELLPYDKQWEFSIENLKLEKQLGSGAFGVVIRGLAKRIVPEEEFTTVAIKMAKRSAEPSCIRALASELKIMAHLGKHLNVVNLLGACTKNIAKKELLVIVEYCKYGNIHNYLYRHRNAFINQINPEKGFLDFNIGIETLERWLSAASSRSRYQMKNADEINDNLSCTTTIPNKSREVNKSPKVEEGEDYDVVSSAGSYVHPKWRTNYKPDYKGSVRPICTKDLIIWAFQVARGMEYLASRKVLHGDLAARNILLTDDNVVKICDFGLSKSIYQNESYKMKNDCPLPIKWMAVESIRDRVFSTQSDVWAFGVVLWEFFSLAEMPYPGMEADEKFYAKLLDGYRMESPEYAIQEIYQIMLACWSHYPLNRPSFMELSDKIGCILEEGVKKHYLELNIPYLETNSQRLQNSTEDYLAMVSSPNFENLSSPNHYMNELGSSSGYLSMNRIGAFSPQNAGNICNIDKKKANHNSEDCQSAIELQPILGQNEKLFTGASETFKEQHSSEITNENIHFGVDSPTCSVSNPSYSIPPSIPVETDKNGASGISVKPDESIENITAEDLITMK